MPTPSPFLTKGSHTQRSQENLLFQHITTTPCFILTEKQLDDIPKKVKSILNQQENFGFNVNVLGRFP